MEKGGAGMGHMVAKMGISMESRRWRGEILLGMMVAIAIVQHVNCASNPQSINLATSPGGMTASATQTPSISGGVFQDVQHQHQQPKNQQDEPDAAVRGDREEERGDEDKDKDEDQSRVEDWQVAQARLEEWEMKRAMRLEEMGNSTNRRVQAAAEMLREDLQQKGSLELMSRRCWGRLDPLPCGRSGATAVSFSGRPYLIGGTDDRMVFEDVRAFWPQREEWREEAELDERRAYHASATIGGSIWVSGGFDGDDMLSSCERLVPGARNWEPCAPLAKRRMNHAMVALGGMMYVLGGSTYTETYTRFVEVYDPAKHSWSESVPLSYGRNRLGAIAFGGRIYVIGGLGVDGALDTCESWAPGESIWRDEQPMMSPRHSMGVVEMCGRVYVLGGYDGESLLSTTESFARGGLGEGAEGWRPEPTLDMPARSQAICVAGGVLYAMGGFGLSHEKPWTPPEGWEDAEDEGAAEERLGGAAGGAEAAAPEVAQEVQQKDVICSLRGVAVSSVESFVFVGEAMDTWKNDKPPEDDEFIDAIGEMINKIHDNVQTEQDLEKLLDAAKWQAGNKQPGVTGEGAAGGEADDDDAVAGEGGEDPGSEGMMDRLKDIFNDAMGGVDIDEANATMIEGAKRRLIESLVMDQMDAVRASQIPFDKLGKDDEDSDSGRVKHSTLRHGGSAESAWSLPAERGAQLPKVLEMVSDDDDSDDSDGRRRGRRGSSALSEDEDEEEDDARDDAREEDGARESNDAEQGHDEQNEAQVKQVKQVKHIRLASEGGRGGIAGIEYEEEGQIQDVSEESGEMRDSQSEGNEFSDALDAFSKGKLPKQVERLYRKVRREERDVERNKDRVVEDASEVIDHSMKKENPREYLRGLVGGIGRGGEVGAKGTSFEEKSDVPLTEAELFMQTVKKLRERKGGELLEKCDIEQASRSEELLQKWEHLQQQPGGISSSSSVPDDWSEAAQAAAADALPLRGLPARPTLDLLDKETRRRAAEANIKLPDKLESGDDVRAYLKELLA